MKTLFQQRLYLQILRYLYTYEIRLNATNAIGILLLADHYKLPEIEQKCVEFLIKTVTTETVLNVFKRTYKLTNKLTEHCLDIIRKDTDKLFGLGKGPDLVNLFEHDLAVLVDLFDLDLAVLGTILELDVLRIDSEVELFEELLRWARAKCVAENVEPNAANLRRVVKGRLRLVRLTAMSHEQFQRCIRIAGPGFFSIAESGGIFEHQNRRLNGITPEKQRKN